MDARARPSSAGGTSPAGIALAGLGGLAVAIGVGRFALTPLLPAMQAEASVSLAEGAWLASANYTGYLVGALSAAAVRVPPAAGIRAGLVLIAAATLGMGVEQRLAGWIVLRWLAGVASAWVLIGVSASCLARLSPLGRPVLSSTVFAGVGAGTAVTGGLCLVLTRLEAGAALGWLALGVVALVVTIFVWRPLGVDSPPPGVNARGGPGHARHARGEIARLILGYGAFGFGYIVPATFLPVLARDLVADPRMLGWAWPVFGAAAAGSTLAVAVLTPRIDGRRLWVIAQLVMAAGVGAPVVWPGTGGVLTAGVLVGGTFMVVTMLGMQEAHRVGGGASARLMSAMTAAFAAGQIAGPLVVGLLAGADGDLAASMLGASAVLVAGAAALMWRGAAPGRWTAGASPRASPLPRGGPQ